MYTTITKAHYDVMLAEIADLRAKLELQEKLGSVNYMDGEWHAWSGGECPVPSKCTVEIEFRYGEISVLIAVNLDWSVDGHDGDIIKFRVINVK